MTLGRYHYSGDADGAGTERGDIDGAVTTDGYDTDRLTTEKRTHRGSANYANRSAYDHIGNRTSKTRGGASVLCQGFFGTSTR